MKVELSTIKELRARTGLGLADCKKALEKCSGNIEEAVSKLRVTGLVKADKKADRIANDGLIAMNCVNNAGVLVEVKCETDFVARNERFMNLVSDVSLIALQGRCTSVESLNNAKYGTGIVKEAILNETLVLGEKIELSRICHLEVKNGIVAGYVHGSGLNLGKIGALVALEAPSSEVALREIGRQIAMHIVAMKPEALSMDDLNKEQLAKERSFIEEQVKGLNKSKEVTTKIIDGRLAKYYEEVVLLEQKFIRDDKVKIGDLIKLSELDLGCPVKLCDYKLLILA